MKKDVVTKLYMEDDERFADAFNYALFDGKPVISQDNLIEKDSEEESTA